MPASPGADTSKARAAAQNTYANRAVDDPVKLARAARIVRAALERGRPLPTEVGLTISAWSARGGATG